MLSSGPSRVCILPHNIENRELYITMADDPYEIGFASSTHELLAQAVFDAPAHTSLIMSKSSSPGSFVKSQLLLRAQIYKQNIHKC